MESRIPEAVAKVKSLYKALGLLDSFTIDEPERGVNELAAYHHLNKATVSNILQTFEICGYLQKNPSNGKYSLGLKLLELSNRLSRLDLLSRTICEYMEVISRKSGETVFFATDFGDGIIYREAVSADSASALRPIKGITAPFHCTGLGKAILAYLPVERQEKILTGGLERFTENTLTDPGDLRAELAAIRHQGYALDNMEHEFGIKCVAMPILDSCNHLIGALSISGPSLRFAEHDEKIYLELLEEAIEKIRHVI